MDSDNELFEDLEALEAIELINNRRLFTRPRIYRERSKDFVKYDDKDFFIRYRLSKESVLFILQEIENQLEFNDDRNNSVPPINQVLCALRFYATGNQLMSVADLNGISVATCSRIVKRVSQAIVSLRREFIRFPDTEVEQHIVKEEFYRIARFPNVLGCIDCTHIKIQSPGGDDAELFRNRKSYMSINMQTISTAKLLITDVVARWPGSTHDSTIYQNSQRYTKFEHGDYRGNYLLGDSGYPLKSHLLTPYLNPVSRGQQKYNEAHIKTRNVVERQYGVLKRRFPVLAVGIRLQLPTAINVILACCVLHNICIIRKEHEPINDGTIPNLEELIVNGQIPQIPITVNDPTYGFQRNQITQYFDNL
ncbi:putative nuclease HARBI1 [Plodia interpunctella]|uniref:putative nuclease HARBI1 n=1 Tax=Plodia interpunctella TaxID=58824 RepID=UPI002368139F|nr:putative nuclease HARBI1 [Plodia interpunctella]